MAIALGALAVIAGHPSRTTVGFALALFGLGFGMVGQVLITAVQNSVDRRELGIAMATTSFFRGLGGAIGAAVFGAIFAGQAGAGAAGSGLAALGAATRTDIIDGVQAVFLAAAPVALLALAIVLALREVPLSTGQPPASGRQPAAGQPPSPDGQGGPERSLPLDRAGRLAGDVQHDPANRANLAGHA
jgi:MFS family permease